MCWKLGNNHQMAPSRCTRRRRPLRVRAATTKPAAPQSSPSPLETTTADSDSPPPPPLPGSSPSDHILFDHSFSAKTNAGGGDGCSTPKAKRFRIPEPETCPPAPKKRRPLPETNSTCSSLRRSPIPFLASPDIELFFFQLALRTSDQRAS